MGPTEQLEKRQQQAPVTKPEEQLSLRQHLIDLQRWDVPEGSTIEEQKAEYAHQTLLKRQQDLQVVAGHVQQLPVVKATKVAEGTPIQQTAPADETYKERRQKRAETRRAQKENPEANYVSYRLKAACEMRDISKENALAPFLKDAVWVRVDLPQLQNLCTGYQKDKKGQPLNAVEAQKKQQDDRLIKDFFTMDSEKREPYMKAYSEKILNIPLTKAMLTDEYITEHIGYLKEIVLLASCYRDLRKDPTSNSGFIAQDKHTQDSVSLKCEMIAKIGKLVDQFALANCFDWRKGTYTQPGSRDPQTARAKVNAARLEAANEMDRFGQSQLEVDERHVDRLTGRYRNEILDQAEDLHDENSEKKGQEDLGLSGGLSYYAYEELASVRKLIETHPAEYEASKTLVDDLYQKMHHIIDASGINITAVEACQNVINSYNHRTTPEAQRLVRITLRRQEMLNEERLMLQGQSGAVKDALAHLLTGKQLTGFGAMAMDQDLSAHFPTIIAQRARNTPLPPPQPGVCTLKEDEVAESLKVMGEAVEISNKGYAENANKGPVERRAGALVQLGIRTSSTEAAKANAKLRDEAIKPLAQDYVTFFKNLEEQNVPLGYTATHLTSIQLDKSASKYHCGGGIEAISGQMLNMFAEYMRTDAAQEYLRRAATLYKQSDALEHSNREIMEFLLQAAVNSAGANYSQVAVAPDETFKAPETVKTIAKLACQNLLTLSALLRQNKETLSTLTPEMTQLLASYEALVEEMRQKYEAKPG